MDVWCGSRCCHKQCSTRHCVPCPEFVISLARRDDQSKRMQLPLAGTPAPKHHTLFHTRQPQPAARALELLLMWIGNHFGVCVARVWCVNRALRVLFLAMSLTSVYFISSLILTIFSRRLLFLLAQDLVMQYEVQIRDGAKCGGAYVKVSGRRDACVVASFPSSPLKPPRCWESVVALGQDANIEWKLECLLLIDSPLPPWFSMRDLAFFSHDSTRDLTTGLPVRSVVGESYSYAHRCGMTAATAYCKI